MPVIFKARLLGPLDQCAPAISNWEEEGALSLHRDVSCRRHLRKKVLIRRFDYVTSSVRLPANCCAVFLWAAKCGAVSTL